MFNSEPQKEKAARLAASQLKATTEACGDCSACLA
jgi:hypothetical protein